MNTRTTNPTPGYWPTTKCIAIFPTISNEECSVYLDKHGVLYDDPEVTEYNGQECRMFICHLVADNEQLIVDYMQSRGIPFEDCEQF
jgi:hypothetical protein